MPSGVRLEIAPMNCITYLSNLQEAEPLPDEFPNPFRPAPHPLARRACESLQRELEKRTEWHQELQGSGGGKMFGVLVVVDGEGRLGYLSAFSGMLAGKWNHPGFVPPLFDLGERKRFFPDGEARLAKFTDEIQRLQSDANYTSLLEKRSLMQTEQERDLTSLKAIHKERKSDRHAMRSQVEGADRSEILHRMSLESQQDRRELKERTSFWCEKIERIQHDLDEFHAKIKELKSERASLSNSLHLQIFEGYRLTNGLGEERPLTRFFTDGLPPGGAGDCAGPKLIHYANTHRLTPIALAEFWWGASPTEEVRRHGEFYPACRGKCGPILPFMLEGYSVEPPPAHGIFPDGSAPEVLYEDEHLLVVNKPSGLLSVPGKEIGDSVESRIRTRDRSLIPEGDGPILVHRLDMSTSGVLLIAKSKEIHKILQKQFLTRKVEKRYVALLAGRLPESPGQGLIELPLRVDLNDRPRQMVCYEHGKPAATRWQIVDYEQELTRVHFYPVTGRTHQLRMHAAHKGGLGVPIKGDDLYGDGDGRLCLHAESLAFVHPVSGRPVVVEAKAPF